MGQSANIPGLLTLPQNPMNGLMGLPGNGLPMGGSFPTQSPQGGWTMPATAAPPTPPPSATPPSAPQPTVPTNSHPWPAVFGDVGADFYNGVWNPRPIPASGLGFGVGGNGGIGNSGPGFGGYGYGQSGDIGGMAW